VRASVLSAPQPHVDRDVRAAGAVTIEVWVTPANTTQGTASYANVLSSSVSIMLRNFGIEQRGDAWVGRLRTSATNVEGEPAIVAPGTVVTTAPTHLVLTGDAAHRTLYVNGVAVETMPSDGGTFTSWDPNYRIAVGDEVGANRAWLGTIWLLAIYDVALQPNEVMQNFSAGFDCTGC
jgi:hypothetical protein